MNLQELSINTALRGLYNSRENFSGMGKPGGQTSSSSYAPSDDYSVTYFNAGIEFKTGSLSDGIVVEGYYLGTYEFDSLTGHPGIKY